MPSLFLLVILVLLHSGTNFTNITLGDINNITGDLISIEQKMDESLEKDNNLLQEIQKQFAGSAVQHEKILKQNEDNNLLNIILQFFGILGGVGVPILLYWIDRRRDETNSLNRASNSLLREVSHNEVAITGKMGYEVIEYEIERENEFFQIFYTNAFLDSDAYDSVISSGQFMNFSVKTQGTLRELYNRTKDHNITIRYSTELEDQLVIDSEKEPQLHLQNVPSEAILRYDENLTYLEMEMKELFPKVISSLKSEIKKWYNTRRSTDES